MAARPPGSRAVTVTVAVPAAPGTSQTVPPDAKAATATASLDAAAKVRGSSSGSLNQASMGRPRGGPDSASAWGGTVPTGSGGRLHVSPWKSTAASHA